MVAQSILIRPIVTEKSTLLQEERTYVFEVLPEATKQEIRRAVETAFDVKVERVNTMRVLGKRKRFGARLSRQKSWKKAIVTLAPGESITIFEGV
jgi:large subunit ribosomal protein L23